MEFSKRLASAMNEAGMTAAELSQKTGISPGAISSYIKGRYEPKQNNIFLIARALGVPEAYLLGLKEPVDTVPPWASKRHKVLYDRIRNATDEQLEKMEKIWELIEEEEEKYDL